MSELNFEDELVLEYLAECREHLATIETDLLAIEQRGSDIDEQLVNRVFRAAHSIKGGAGFFSLARIRELAHRTENVLDLVRSRQMIPTAEVVSMLLTAFDKLRELIDHYRESDEIDIEECVLGLVRLTEDNLPVEERNSIVELVPIPGAEARVLIEVAAFDLNQARKGGQHIYLIRYDLIHDVQRRGLVPYEVVKNLLGNGAILETAFDLESAGTLDDEPSNGLFLQVLYATPAGPETIAELVNVPMERISVIEANDAMMRPAEPVAVAAPAEPVAVHTAVHSPREHSSAPALMHSGTDTSPKPAQVPTFSQSESTVRLNVAVLDTLMTLAGELVLSRNQLNESLARQDERGIRSGAQRVSLVTSELQEVVTLTRMQPVGNVFSKFPRLVRDLARDLGKEAQLRIDGAEVELDKTILEGLSDPLTHMVRNSVDHGIEPPDVRVARGKPRMGTITLRASHQAGLVVIEISDDGKGLDPEKVAASSLAKGLVTRDQLQTMSDREKMSLILLPGVSTAEKVSDVSGRGVGMDVVKTNLDKLGGKMEIDSTPGHGTWFRIKLPLTLAIIPSLLISDSGQRFAIPQVNVGELIRIPVGQLAQRIDRVGDAEVLILRDRLVPLLHLGRALGHPAGESGNRTWNVVLVDTGAFEYGLVVEELHATIEIVVKPLGRHLKGIPDYAGATILGDGRVAVILDVAGLAARGGISAASTQALARRDAKSDSAGEDEAVPLLLFQNAPGESCAVPIDLVSRVERVRPEQMEYLGGRRTMQYRGASLPVITLADVASAGQISENQAWVVVVFEHAGWALGLLAAEPLDMIETNLVIDRHTLRQTGIAGSALIKGRTTLIVDILELVQSVRPEWAEAALATQMPGEASKTNTTVLLAEDSDFFRGQIKRLIEAVGYTVLPAEDGQAAWELLQEHPTEIALVATDIEMPRMDGIALTRRIRADERFSDLPVIAITTLAEEDEIARGLAAGVTEYQVKLNKDELLNSIRRAVGSTTNTEMAHSEAAGLRVITKMLGYM